MYGQTSMEPQGPQLPVTTSTIIIIEVTSQAFMAELDSRFHSTSEQ
jgi:hypothetical protein